MSKSVKMVFIAFSSQSVKLEIKENNVVKKNADFNPMNFFIYHQREKKISVYWILGSHKAGLMWDPLTVVLLRLGLRMPWIFNITSSVNKKKTALGNKERKKHWEL